MFQICDISQITSSRTVCLIPKTQGDARPSHLVVGKPRLGVPNPEIQLQVGVGLSRWRTCSVRAHSPGDPPERGRGFLRTCSLVQDSSETVRWPPGTVLDRCHQTCPSQELEGERSGHTRVATYFSAARPVQTQG